MNDMDDNISGLLESSRIFKRERIRHDNLIREVENAFLNIWTNLRNPYAPALEDRQFDITLFRKCIDVVSTTDKTEYDVLRILQDFFIEIYLDPFWDPPLLTKLLVIYFGQWLHCYKFVSKRKSTISEMLQLVGVSTHSDSIRTLMSVFDKYMWSVSHELEKDLDVRFNKETDRELDEKVV